MVEKLSDTIKKIMDDAPKKSAQFNQDLEQLISKYDLDKYECEVSVEEIQEGMKLAIRRLKRKQGR